MIHELAAPIPCETSKGAALCYAWLDYGVDHEILWQCCITETREWWLVPQSQVRGVKNWSLGRDLPAPPKPLTPRP